jgi:hypothetical protein
MAVVGVQVSLLAYIQSQLGNHHDVVHGVSPLGAVMGFLYSTYIVLYTVIAIGIGRIFDHFNTRGEPHKVSGLSYRCLAGGSS